ncbi:hypothetical protein NC653_007351 [Populus alba x Populus x berolinensis]|uniref:Uncharacterized protein n=1 Tax=Populus alba x Populus x berolinensis TaxID=444605 RepID=A0AAD6WDD2_9ROSI|nr:hypothetical protein NC653_007351 [Populus alba x Populus x berolinensis]
MKMQKQQAFTFLLLAVSLTFPSLIHCLGAKCATNAPSVQQTQVGNGTPPSFMVEVQNNCPMCPVINIHLKCGSFPQALVNPRLLKVVAPDDCVVNGGLPLSPLQRFSFNYSHQKEYQELENEQDHATEITSDCSMFGPRRILNHSHQVPAPLVLHKA